MIRQFSDADVLPDRIVLYAQKGWGKSTFAALAPKPIILMSANETGYLTLARNKLVPAAPFAVIDSWLALDSQLNELIVKGADGAETLVLDALGGYERLCHEYICKERYKGDWGEHGFLGFQRGFNMSVPEIDRMLATIDRVRAKLNLRIILLAHSRIRNAPNPMGADFQQYTVDCHDKTWECVKRWADMVLFGKHRTQVGEIDGDKKGLGISGDREMYCTFIDAAEAGNRHGLPPRIDMPKKASEMWQAFAQKLAAGCQPVAAAARPAAASPTPAQILPAAAPASTVNPAAPVKTDGAQQTALLMELEMLIKFHQLEGSVPKVLAHFKRDRLDQLTDDQVRATIERIRKAHQDTKAA